MKWFKLGAIAVFLLILVSSYLTFTETPRASDSAEPSDIAERIKAAEPQFTNLRFRNISTAGDRIQVEAEYRGSTAEKPREAAEWHQLAERTAERLYQDIVRNRGVEVHVYEGSSRRAVAVAGL